MSVSQMKDYQKIASTPPPTILQILQIQKAKTTSLQERNGDYHIPHGMLQTWLSLRGNVLSSRGVFRRLGVRTLVQWATSLDLCQRKKCLQVKWRVGTMYTYVYHLCRWTYRFIYPPVAHITFPRDMTPFSISMWDFRMVVLYVLYMCVCHI